MNARASQVPPSVMEELTMHLRKSGNPLLPALAASALIRAWITAQEQPAAATAGPALPADDRRDMAPRRAIDILADQCAFD